MKFVATIFVLFLIHYAFAGTPDSLLSPSTVEARITFPEDDFDFGEITQGIVAEHVFAFSNTGNDTLRISSVRSS